VRQRTNSRCRAAQFLEQQGQPEHALALALDGQDWPGSVRLVCAEAARLIAQGRGQVLRDWIAAIPKDVQNTAPWLAYWRGASLIAVDPTAAIGVIAHAADRLRDSAESFGDMLACAGVIHAIYLEWSDLTKMDDWINRLEALMEKRPALPSTDAALSIYSALLIGCFNRKPASHALEFAADEVETLLQQEANPNLKVTASMALLFYLAASRQLARARPLLDLMVPVVEGSSISPLNRMMWWSRAGIVFIRCSEFQEAAKAIRTAEDISRHGGAAFRSVVVHMPTAFLAAINRDDVLGKQTIQAMEQSRDPRRKLDECFVHYASCMLASVHGDPADIVRHGEKGLRSARAGGMYFSEIGLQFSIAVGYVQTGNWTEAILQLDQIRDSILGTYLEYCMDDVLAIEVCLAFAQGNIDHGRKVLQTLMSRAVEGGTSFLRYGFVWSTVFSKAIEYRIEAEKASILIRRFQLKSPTYLTDHWPWPVRVHVLGAFELNTELTPSSAAKPAYKLLEMLRTIACHENRGVSVSWVKETLWAESEGDAAERAFHTSLYRLRKLLGNDAAVLHGDGCLRLNPEICWTDLLAFNQIVAEVESHLPSAKTDRLQYLSTRCIELYRGELLAQHREIAWTIAPRDRTRSQFRRTLSRLGEAWEQAGAPDKAMELYQLGIERDNLAEEFYRRLMLCYQTRGDHAEAINVYRRCRELLSVVLGTTPSAQTQAVRASLGV
jgi:DNA-binding SARP family transcriptional activator